MIDDGLNSSILLILIDNLFLTASKSIQNIYFFITRNDAGETCYGNKYKKKK